MRYSCLKCYLFEVIKFLHTHRRRKMNRNSIFLILVGMLIQAVIAVGLSLMHAITLSTTQQVITAALFVIVNLGWFILKKNFNKIFIGMAIQALVIALLAQLVQFNPVQQAIAGVFVIVILFFLNLRKK